MMDIVSRKFLKLLADIIAKPDKESYTREEVIALLENTLGISDAELRKEGLL